MKIAIVGGGPAGLMAAHQIFKLNPNICIDLYDANKAVARKFLVAGHGGFNLSNNKPLDQFLEAYDHKFIKDAVEGFTPDDTISWLTEIGIPTYIGSSGKLFPQKGIKPIEVLNAWLKHLHAFKFEIFTEHRLLEVNENAIVFDFKGHEIEKKYDYYIFSMGGASWSKTGSDGRWTNAMIDYGYNVIPFQASNSGVVIQDWSTTFQGKVIKHCLVDIGGVQKYGEIILTDYGFEGAPIYALSSQVRDEKKNLTINFKSAWSKDKLQSKFRSFKGNKSAFLKSINLCATTIHLIKSLLSKEEFNDDVRFLEAIHALQFSIQSLRPIDEVISTVGGIDFEEVNGFFQSKKNPQHYFVGEMLNWDAPTGGYLLQACFSTGYACAKSILSF